MVNQPLFIQWPISSYRVPKHTQVVMISPPWELSITIYWTSSNISKKLNVFLQGNCHIFKLYLGDTQLCWESHLKIALFANVFEIKLCLLQKGREHLLEPSIPKVFSSQGHRIQTTSEHSPKFLKNCKKRHSWSEVLKT